jgi:hypothetical protein
MACRGLYFVFDVLPQTSGDELYTSGTQLSCPHLGDRISASQGDLPTIVFPDLSCFAYLSSE